MSRKHLVAHCIWCTAVGAERQLYSLKSKRRASRLLQEFPGHEVGDAKDGGKSLELQGGLTRATSTEPGPFNSNPFLPNTYQRFLFDKML